MRHSTFLDIQLPMLARNVKRIRNLVSAAPPNASSSSSTRVLPMVKGDAYGHGIARISHFLATHCECPTLGVASLHEAVYALEHLPGVQQREGVEYVVFSDTELQEDSCNRFYTEGMGKVKISPVVGTAEDLSYFLEHCSGKFKDVPLMVKVNTGMNRMGVEPEALRAALPRIKATRGRIDHMLQHFSTSWFPADGPDATTTTDQFTLFQQLKSEVQDAGVSLLATSVANSGAIEQGVGTTESFVRPGLMLYGPPSVTEPKQLWDGEQIGAFRTKIIKTFTVTSATCVGYGFNATRGPCVIAVLPIGYADGFLRYNTGLPLEIAGLVGEVHGFVNMDMTAVAFYPYKTGLTLEAMQGRLEQTAAASSSSGGSSSSPVTIWGHDNRDIDAKATFLKTNAYQLMTALSVRVPRRYNYGSEFPEPAPGEILS